MSDENKIPPLPPRSPSCEPDDYRGRDFALKEKALRFQRFSFWIACGSLVVSISGFAIVLHSLNSGELALRNNVQQSMTKLVVDLDRTYIDHPELRQYFTDAINPNETTNYARAAATAIMALDIMDLAIGQAGTFRKQWTAPEAWTNWVVDEFRQSPFLREQYEKHTKWYGLDMYTLEGNIKSTSNYVEQYREPSAQGEKQDARLPVFDNTNHLGSKPVADGQNRSSKLTSYITASIALMLAWIAFQQYLLAREKFKLDLFEKRFAVYKATQKFLVTTIRNSRGDWDHALEHRRETQDAVFLFGQEIVAYLNLLHEKAVAVGSLQAKYDPTPVGPGKTALAEEVVKRNYELNEELQRLPGVFAPYLKFKAWHRFFWIG